MQLTSGKTLDEGQLVRNNLTYRAFFKGSPSYELSMFLHHVNESDHFINVTRLCKVLLASKLGLERSLADVETIKSQLEEVAKLVAAQAPSSSVTIASCSPVTEVIVRF